MRCVCVDTLHSIFGVWLHGALLHKDLSVVPYHIFRFSEKREHQRVAWWSSVWSEVKFMVNTLPLKEFDATVDIGHTFFVSDAMGGDSVDNGNFGITAAQINPDIVNQCLEAGFSPGYSVARLDGNGGFKYPNKSHPTIPISKWPDDLTDPAVMKWVPIDRGRWQFRAHITLGEGRAAIRVLQIISQFSALHNKTHINLEDNQPISASFAKGRSPTIGLNCLLRKRAGICAAYNVQFMLPWIETSRMPADEISRLRQCSRQCFPSSVALV